MTANASGGGGAPANVTVPTSGPLNNQQWATLVLQDANLPVTANNLQVIMQWMTAENPTSDWYHNNNPLNNGYNSPSTPYGGGSGGTGTYPNLYVAAQAVADNLTNPSTSTKYGYGNIVTALENDADPSVTAAAIWASSWASSHYGMGSHWPGVVTELVNDTSQGLINQGPASPSSTPPSNPTAGQTFTDSLGDLWSWAGSAWVYVPPSDQSSSAIGGATPNSPLDAVTIGGVTQDISNLNPTKTLVGIWSALTSASTWKRIGIGMLGLLLILASLLFILSGSKTVDNTVGAAASAAV